MRPFERLDLETCGCFQGHCIATIDPDNSTKRHQLLVYLLLGVSIISGHFVKDKKAHGVKDKEFCHTCVKMTRHN